MIRLVIEERIQNGGPDIEEKLKKLQVDITDTYNSVEHIDVIKVVEEIKKICRKIHSPVKTE